MADEDGRGRGGKLMRSRQHIRMMNNNSRAKPYQRNPSFRSDADDKDASSTWLSKLAAGAGKLLFSAFGHHPTTSFSSSSSHFDTSDDDSGQEVQTVENILEGDTCKDMEQPIHMGSKSTKVAEIEQVLSSKTFTWEEFIYLTELLQSRIVESPPSKELGNIARPGLYGRAFAREIAVQEAQRWSDERKNALKEGANIKDALCNISPLNLSAEENMLDDSISSPVNIAKSYMELRPAWASSHSPLALGSDLDGNESRQNKIKSTLNCNVQADGFQSLHSTSSNKSQNMINSPSNLFGARRSPFCMTYSQYTLQMAKRSSSGLDGNFAYSGTIKNTHQKTCGLEEDQILCKKACVNDQGNGDLQEIKEALHRCDGQNSVSSQGIEGACEHQEKRTYNPEREVNMEDINKESSLIPMVASSKKPGLESSNGDLTPCQVGDGDFQGKIAVLEKSNGVKENNVVSCNGQKVNTESLPSEGALETDYENNGMAAFETSALHDINDSAVGIKDKSYDSALAVSHNVQQPDQEKPLADDALVSKELHSSLAKSPLPTTNLTSLHDAETIAPQVPERTGNDKRALAQEKRKKTGRNMRKTSASTPSTLANQKATAMLPAPSAPVVNDQSVVDPSRPGKKNSVYTTQVPKKRDASSSAIDDGKKTPRMTRARREK